MEIFKETLSATGTWFEVWLDNFGDPNQSGLWRMETRDGPLAIPYVTSDARVAGMRIPIAAGAVNAHTPRYDVLGTLSAPGPTLLRMMQDLGVVMLQFPYLSRSSELVNRLNGDGDPLLVHLEHCETAPYVDTSGNWEDYWAGRGKSRQEWGRRERKLMGSGGSRFTCLTRWADVGPLFRDILEIEASGWKGKEGSAIVQDARTLGFYTDLARRWADDGRLRLFLLYDGDVPIAFELDAELNGILHCFKHGYLEDRAKSGPGQVLRMQVLRWAFGNPAVRVFDMFGPDTEAKRKWATGAEALQTAKLFRKSPLGLLAWSRFSFAPRVKARVMPSKPRAEGH